MPNKRFNKQVPGFKKGGEVKGKYPSKGMNKLASKRPDVAKKIMGYKEGGRMKKMGGGMSTARKDMMSGYYKNDMGMKGGAMYKEGGKVKKKKSRKNPMKDDRAREGLKSQYRKMGMGKMIDSGEIDFSEYKDGGRAKQRRMGPPARDKKKGRKGGRGSFPDLTGDGKVTRADVLKGRGVFKSGGIAKRGKGCEIR